MTNEELIQKLVRKEALRTPGIIEAFERTDRVHFVPERYRSYAYDDTPLPLAPGSTISQPSTVAFMLELLGAEPGNHILDIGAGSGWTTALLARLAGPTGRVLGLEINKSLAERAHARLHKLGVDNAAVKHTTDLGTPGETYERILVGASAKAVPRTLVEQLDIGGVMVVPVKDTILRIERTGQDTTTVQEFRGFVFVPLREASEA